VGGWVDGWMDGWVGVKAILRIAYSNQKLIIINFTEWRLQQYLLISLSNP
jgi:hypothetical protein